MQSTIRDRDAKAVTGKLADQLRLDPETIRKARKALAEAAFPNHDGGYVRRDRKAVDTTPLPPSERFARLQAAYLSHAKTPDERKQNPPRGQHVHVVVLGQPCRVAKREWERTRDADDLRRQIPQDLSVNAVAERRSRGLGPFEEPLPRYPAKTLNVKVPMRPTRLHRRIKFEKRAAREARRLNRMGTLVPWRVAA